MDVNKIDMIEYSNKYCEMDVYILEKGFNIFIEFNLFCCG